MARKQDISPAFVEGLDVSAYGIARSLGRHGIPVYALNSNLREALRYSRYCRACFLYPDDLTQRGTYASESVAKSEEVLTRLLLEWSARFSERPVLFAGSDWFPRLLALRRRELESRFLFHWIEPELFSTIVDKGRMAAFCQQAGIRVPRTHITRPEDDVALISREFPHPCLVKPVHYFASFPLQTAKVFVAQTPEQLQSFFATYPHLKGATLVQELIEGGDDQVFQCTALVNGAGEIAAYATVRKLRQYPAGCGSMCHGRTEPNEVVASESFRLLRALGYRGLGSLEFKYRQKDGAYYFIEMNTRQPWYNGIFADAGVNLAHLAYLDLTGQAPAAGTMPNQRQNTTWLGFHNYSLGRRETRSQRPVTFGEYFSAVARAKSFAWWNWKDPAPFLASGWFALRGLGGKALRRMGLRQMSRT